jgi:hypothetical protein
MGLPKIFEASAIKRFVQSNTRLGTHQKRIHEANITHTRLCKVINTISLTAIKP